MNLSPEIQNKIAKILSETPEEVTLEWQLVDGVIRFTIAEKPVTFSRDQERELIEKLNATIQGSEKQEITENNR